MEESPTTTAREAAAAQARLQEFLERYLGDRVLETNEGALRMLILRAKSSRNKTPKEKLIVWMLLRLNERLLDPDQQPSSRDLVVCDFLLTELGSLVAT